MEKGYRKPPIVEKGERGRERGRGGCNIVWRTAGYDRLVMESPSCQIGK